ALTGSIGYNKNNFRFLGMDMRNFNVSFENRVINKEFNSLDRINPVEFNRDFNVLDSSKVTENLRQGNLTFAPAEYLRLDYNFGQLLRGDIFNSVRNIGSIKFNGDSLGLPFASYAMEILNSSYTPLSLDGTWIKHAAELGYRKPFGGDAFTNPYLEVKVTYFNEDKQDRI